MLWSAIIAYLLVGCLFAFMADKNCVRPTVLPFWITRASVCVGWLPFLVTIVFVKANKGTKEPLL